jgi:hypothetical protein
LSFSSLRLFLRIVKNKKKIILWFLLIVSTIFIYKSDRIMFDVIDKIDKKTKRILALGNKRDSLMKLVEEINPFNNKFFYSSMLNDVPTFDVKLNKKNIDYINSVIERSLDMKTDIFKKGTYISAYDNNFVDDTKCKVIYKGEKYKGKIKIHGIDYSNFLEKKKSYTIKLKKDKLIDNVRKFGLILLDEQSTSAMFSYYVSKKFNYMNVKSEIVRLRFNGVDQGLYLYEELLSKELLEKNNLSGVDVIKVLDEWTTQYLHYHVMPFSDEVAYTNFKNNSKKNVGQLLRYKKLMKSEKYSELEDLIDVDKFAKHEAMRILFGDNHSVAGDNLKLLYNTSNGRFFPYFRMESYLYKLKFTNRSKTFDQDMNIYGGGRYYIRLFKILNQNSDFRNLRNKYLYHILQNKNDLINYYDKLIDKYIPIIEKDKTNNYPFRWYFNKIKNERAALTFNFNVINKYLKYSRVYTTLIKNNEYEYELEISPDSNVPLVLSDVLIEKIDMNETITIIDQQKNTTSIMNSKQIKKYFSNRMHSLSLDKDLEVEKRVYKYKFIFNNKIDLENISLIFLNKITGQELKKKNVYFKYIIKPLKYSFDTQTNSSVEKFITSNTSLRVENNDLIFTKGKYFINNDIVIPKTYNVVIKGGVEIIIEKNKSFVVYGNLNIQGKDDTVTIRNKIKNDSFGVFAAIGDGKTKIKINGLDLYGGYQDNINGMFLSGALSLYNHESVILENSFIHHNGADDGLNIKNSRIFLRNNLFNANKADQVDLDFCSGTVIENRFIDISIIDDSDIIDVPVDDNGDGLDFSGSKIIVTKNKFDGFLDKGVSIGENTQALLYMNTFTGNRSAITAKDHSKVYIMSNMYQKNSINIEMYQKKKIFEHPSVYNINEIHDNIRIKKTQNSHYYKLNSEIKDNDVVLDVDIFNELDNKNWKEYE